MHSFYYKVGPVETNIPWTSPVSQEKINEWWNDFKQLDLEDYSVYLGGKYAIDPLNTDDIDICLTGPVYDYMRLYELLKIGTDLGLNKHNILIDIKHYDNVDFFKYPRSMDFKRYHICTELSGVLIKKIDNKVVEEKFNKTFIPVTTIPDELAVNLVEFPLEKQIKDGRIYNPILLNKN
tara:strand:- start:2770 stop:3306 length:537 start_codon:yes stop_codon:yes gene_type:complete